MAEYTGNFELGTHGNDVLTSDSGSVNVWDDRTADANGTLKYSNVEKYDLLSAVMVLSATPSACYVAWSSVTLGTGITTMYGRIYMHHSGLPNANHFFVRGFDTSVLAWEALIGTTGIVHMRDTGGTIRCSSTNVIDTASWIRLEFKAVSSATAGVLECKLFNDADSPTPTETITSTGSFSTLLRTDLIRFGNVTNNNASRTVYMDNVLVNDTGYPGPAPAAPGPSITTSRSGWVW